MHINSSHRNRIDCIHIEFSSRCVEVSVLHLILFLNELGANFVFEFAVGPIAIGITSFSKSSFCFIWIISLGSSQTREFAFIDSLEPEFFSCHFWSKIFYWRFPFSWRSLSSCHTGATFTNVGACSLSLFNWFIQFIIIFILSLLARLFLFLAISRNLWDEFFPSIFIILEILLNQIFKSAFLYKDVFGVILNNLLIFE